MENKDKSIKLRVEYVKDAICPYCNEFIDLTQYDYTSISGDVSFFCEVCESPLAVYLGENSIKENPYLLTYIKNPDKKYIRIAVENWDKNDIDGCAPFLRSIGVVVDHYVDWRSGGLRYVAKSIDPIDYIEFTLNLKDLDNDKEDNK